jgi:pimeloyl-ACP methyl ester carboxylesterase
VNPRGIAGSEGRLDGLTLHDFAADVAGIIERLQCAPAHVLGHAYGNRVARCLAADHPEMVKSVILLAAGGLVGPEPAALDASERLNREDPMSEEEHLRLLRIAYFAAASDPRAWMEIETWTAARRAQLAASVATELADWWTGGTAPMLVIQGLEDATAPPANGRDLKERLGDRVTLVELSGAAHALIPEQPEQVEQAILDWLHKHKN